MKHFSLEYYLTPEDFKVYKKLLIKSLLIAKLKPLLFAFVLVIGFSVFLTVDSDYQMLPVYLLIFAISLTAYLTVSTGQTKEMEEKSLLLKKKMYVDFYSDHFVVNTHPDEFSKSYSEKHYGFDKVMSVVESEGYIYFTFSTNNILIIPKRALTGEQYGMIKNLIENLFADKYRRI